MIDKTQEIIKKVHSYIYKIIFDYVSLVTCKLSISFMSKTPMSERNKIID